MVATMARPKIEVDQYNQEDDGFWDLMGRYFASAKVKRDLGIAMSSDETYIWFLAFADNDLAGFCAIVPQKSGTVLKHLYCISEVKGIDTQLIGCAVAAASKPIHATVKDEELPLYQKFEFKEVKRRGQYIEVRRG